MTNLNRLKVVLVETGKTAKWLAKEFVKSNCTINKWCSNRIQPDLQTIDKIVKILNIDRRTLIEPSDNGENK